ncbi:MAG: hypothetical protein BRD48_02030 [Bacteroidetes bacterium QS_9_68_14]|nr:MAG: hypothetical protein BRD48_02030 [Bacteroidetes bacterium QS_9_68_14]
MANASSLTDRLGTHRPAFDRVFFGLALFGALVAVHLLIQQGRGFDRGCLGFSEPAAAAQANTFNCEMVTQSEAGTLMGVSNAWWGLGFYLAVAGLSVAAASLRGQRLRFSATRAALVGGGLLYSAYLTYHQFAGLGALCALCLTSAGVSFALFLAQGAMLVGPLARGSGTASGAGFRPTRWAAAAAALVVLVGADVAYFSSLDVVTPAQATQAASSEEAPAEEPGARNLASASGAQPAADTAARRRAARPNTTAEDPDTTEDETASAALPPGCQFAPGAERVETSRLVSFGDPVYGNADAPVTVVEFFDPNCPHCKTFHNTMKGLQDRFGEQVRFVYKPLLVMGRQSVNQISALYSAQQQGKFMDMLEGQFARQQRGGLSNDQLATIAREIDMNPGPMLSKIRRGGSRQRITRARKVAQAAGVEGTPAIVIDGRRLARRAKTPQCISAMIQRELGESS